MQPSVERYRLATAGRAGHEDHALGLGKVLGVQILLERFVAERVDAELGLRRIQDAQYDLLAEERRTGAHAKGDCTVLLQLHLDTAVLRDAPLSNIEARHELQTG